jgi:hypothetical protein
MKRVAEIATVMAVVLALAIAAYGVFLLTVGTLVTITPASAPVVELPPTTTERRPDPAGIIPLGFGLLVATGLLVRSWILVGLGVAGIGLFSVLFIFGVGGVLLPAWVALVAVLNLAWLAGRRSA